MFFDACNIEKFWLFFQPLSVAYLSSSSVENLSHAGRSGQAALFESGFEEMRHPPYYPDLVPSSHLCLK